MNGVPLTLYVTSPDGDGAAAKEYVATCLETGSVDPVVATAWAASPARAERSTKPPRITTAEAVMQKLDGAPRTKLQEHVTVFVDEWVHRLPSPPDDTPEDGAGLLAERWRNHAPNTVVFYRSLPSVVVVIVLDFASVDPASGEVVHRQLPKLPGGSGPIAARASLGAGESADATPDFVSAALSVLTVVGFGIGGAGGLTFAAGATVLQTIFKEALAKKTPDPVPEEVDAYVAADLARDKLSEDASNILSYTHKYQQFVTAAAAGHYSDPNSKEYQADYDEMKRILVNALDPGSSLMLTTSQLMSGTDDDKPSWQIAALPVFLLAASMVLLYSKLHILYLTDANSFQSDATADLVDNATQYLDHVTQIKGDIETAISARQNCISGIQEGSYTQYVPGSWGQYVQFIYFTDTASGDQYPPPDHDVSAPDGYDNVVWWKPAEPSWRGPPDYDWKTGDEQRGAYIGKVDDGLVAYYNYANSRAADIEQWIAQVQQTITDYGPDGD